MARTNTAIRPVVEQCWILLGERRGRIWLTRRKRRVSGERTKVAFDGGWVLRREETYGDVVGFLHTHPDGPHALSQRDLRTMRAWYSAFGKPLICLIESPRGLSGWRFDDDQSAGTLLEDVQQFPRDLVIGVEVHGG